MYLMIFFIAEECYDKRRVEGCEDGYGRVWLVLMGIASRHRCYEEVECIDIASPVRADLFKHILRKVVCICQQVSVGVMLELYSGSLSGLVIAIAASCRLL